MGVFGMCVCAISSVAGKPFLRAVARKMHPKLPEKATSRNESKFWSILNLD